LPYVVSQDRGSRAYMLGGFDLYPHQRVSSGLYPHVSSSLVVQFPDPSADPNDSLRAALGAYYHK
jgi:hypothetical protein